MGHRILGARLDGLGDPLCLILRLLPRPYGFTRPPKQEVEIVFVAIAVAQYRGISPADLSPGIVSVLRKPPVRVSEYSSFQVLLSPAPFLGGPAKSFIFFNLFFLFMVIFVVQFVVIVTSRR